MLADVLLSSNLQELYINNKISFCDLLKHENVFAASMGGIFVVDLVLDMRGNS